MEEGGKKGRKGGDRGGAKKRREQEHVVSITWCKLHPQKVQPAVVIELAAPHLPP